LALVVLAARLPTVGGDSNSWGTVMNDFLNVAHESGGNIKSGYITGGMIAENTIQRGDLVDDLINSSKIADGQVRNVDIGNAAVNGSQISTAAAVNVSNLILTGANSTGGLTTGIANITGIFFNRSRINLPSIANQTCTTVFVNITGIPANVSCIPIGEPLMGSSTVINNFTMFGINSTADSCRLLFCNIANQAIDPPALVFGAFGIATASDNDNVVPPL